MEFYKETNLKFVEELGCEIPEDWEVVRLGDVLELLRNGLTYKQNKDGKGYPITRIETISDEKIDHRKVGFIDSISQQELEEYKLKIGDILFSHINSLEHIGKTAIYTGFPEILLHGMNLLLLRPKESRIYSYYLLFLLRFYRLKGVFRNISKKAVNQASINQTQLKNLKIPLPPLEEQRKIAEILSTVDQAIQKTDEIIAKTERLKKGLMQELLSGRVRIREEDGRISFYRETRFNDTEIGKIPEDWEVVRLRDVAEINPEAINPPKEIPDREFYYIEIDSIRDGKINSVKKIIGKNAPSRARRIVRENDVIMSTVRPYLKAFAIVSKEYDGQICSTGFAVLRCKKDLIIPNYLLYNLFMDRTLEQCNRLMVGGQYPALNQSHVEQLKIPLPPLPEQQKIAEILSTVDKKLEIERKEKEKLERIKKGLMDVLLTGRVRVKLDVQSGT